MPVKTVILDARPLVREAITTILKRSPEIEVVDSIHVNSLCDVVKHIRPDIILVNIHHGGHVNDCVQVTTELLESRSRTKIICLLDSVEYAVPLLNAGVKGCLLFADTSASDLIKTVIGIHNGEYHLSKSLIPKLLNHAGEFKLRKDNKQLTPREIETLQLVASGANNHKIAQKLFISEKTVKNHLTRIYRKLGVANRTQAANYAIRVLNL